MIFIIKGFRTIVFIVIVISTTFQPICSPTFFRCLSNLVTLTEFRITSFIESTVCVWGGSYSVSHHHHHHHHIVPLARISLTLSRHFSLLFIASGMSSGLHHVSSHSCCMYVQAGRSPFVRPYVGVHRSASLMSSSLLLQQCPACLVRLAWIVFMMGGRWPYSWCFVGCCRQDLLNIARNILV